MKSMFKSMLVFVGLLCLMGGNIFAQSTLPTCEGTVVSRWTNCFGFKAYSNGNYIGEWESGKRGGYGTYKFLDGRRYIGSWKNGHRDGDGIQYNPDGKIIATGKWKEGNFVYALILDEQRFPFNPITEKSTSDFIGSVTSDLSKTDIEIQNQKRILLEKDLLHEKERQRFTKELDSERKAKKQIEAELQRVQENSIVRDAGQIKPQSSFPTVGVMEQVDTERIKRQEFEAQLVVKPQISQAIKRNAHALVIGNGAYPGSGRLDNPVNDATAISQKLRSMGFTVTTVTDANRQKLVQSMSQFRHTAAEADISLLFYAGHGVQIFGTNYILPTDVDQSDPAQATIQGVSLNSVVESFLPGKTKLVFLDACRDNALQRTTDRSVSKGLAPISAAEGTLISYATKDGQTAADGAGSKNSPFTQALLDHISDPQDIAVVLRKVREKVMKATGGKQQPWEYGSLTGGELVLASIRPK